MNIKSSSLSFTAGLILLTAIYQIVSWKFTVVVMFFWLCHKVELVYENQKKITDNQKKITDNQKTISENQVNLEKIIKKEIK